MKIRCPYCNFETEVPTHGKVLECEGECYTTYSLILPSDDLLRVKMRICEIFFLDGEYNIRATPDEIESRCEFATLPCPGNSGTLIFAREKRPSLDEIESLKDDLDVETDPASDLLERLESAIERYKRDVQLGSTREKLLSDLKAASALISLLATTVETTR